MKPIKPTYGQNWRAYNLAQTNEFSMFQDILVELLDSVLQVRKPLWKLGRPFSNLKDMIFCCVMRTYFGKSARRGMGYLALAKGRGYIERVPHFNTVLNYYRNQNMTPILKHLIEQSGRPLKEFETEFTIDSSGFSTTLYDRWFNARLGSYRKRRMFKKAHITSGVKSNIITAADISPGYHHDHPYFKELVAITAKNFRMREISADAAYLSRENMNQVEELGGIPYIMFKSNVTERARGSLIWKRMHRLFEENKKVFLEHYHKRSNAESVFNMIKRKMGTHLNCKSEIGQINELLCICLAHNVCVLIQELMEANTVLDFKESCEPLVYRH